MRLSAIFPMGFQLTSTVHRSLFMKPPKGSGHLPEDAFPDDLQSDRTSDQKQPVNRQEFETALREATKSLKAVKQRYVEIRRAQHQQQTLRQRLQQADLPLSEVKSIQQRWFPDHYNSIFCKL